MSPILTPSLHRAGLLACMGLAVAAVVVPNMVQFFPARVVYNASASVAPGWYRIEPVRGPDSLHVGSIVLARLPADVAAFAAQRGYLPSGVPILKRIGAVAPQSVCVRDRVVRIDVGIVTTVLVHDGANRAMPAWNHCRQLAQSELFLLSDTHPASFDSRYFGPIATSAVLGVAQPLWTWGTP